MHDQVPPPMSEETIFALARKALGRTTSNPGSRERNPNVPLRIGSCHAKRATPDGPITGYVVTVLVDPRLGVPCNDPTAAPILASSTLLVMHLDAHGAPCTKPA